MEITTHAQGDQCSHQDGQTAHDVQQVPTELSVRIERIARMEKAFADAAVAILGFEQDLSDFENAQETIAALARYYGSEEWFADRDADEAGELPADLERGVLGEDLTYDLLVSYRDLALRMLKAATRALEE